MQDLTIANNLISELEASVLTGINQSFQPPFYTGVDLGTAFTVLVVVDANLKPVSYKMEFANVIRDGLVVDFAGAVGIVRRLKKQLEDEIGSELINAATAVPPKTGDKDCETHRYVVEAAGFEVTNMLDEPTAANDVVQMKNGVIVDIGGGTTGLSILQDGKVVYVADEPTGGTHVSLVLAGSYKIPFDKAELMKRDPDMQKEIFPVVVPVFQKMGSIISRHIKGYDISQICLVGGTCCMNGIEQVIARETGIDTSKPNNPLLTTPLGIARKCKK